ncbi:Deoxyuridine_5'-triphosphate nucleotidohydrolase [Hexamita inflata]|uniref:Deoxyuridine 5'-triphosphate nucleotidohydrolase n=1 Tax=Hexamita inflata TaxID=28002 RepID=A0AA86RAW1_9EUKA|nr:Deoxyuridine 5'-triphosphate nucleotidohydrolase [Hexamita inflata]
METKTIFIKNSKYIPEYKSQFASGADVKAVLTQPQIIKAGQTCAIPTGLFVEIPVGFEIQVRPRSGLALNNSVTVLNTPGTVDADYRGEIKVILINHSQQDFTVNDGDRIAQVVLCPVYQMQFSIVDQLGESQRSIDGFGSTGMK